MNDSSKLISLCEEFFLLSCEALFSETFQVSNYFSRFCLNLCSIDHNFTTEFTLCEENYNMGEERKPDSVVGGHQSGVCVTTHLERPTRGNRGSNPTPCSALLQVGVAKPPGCPDAGGLLPHRSTLALNGRFSSLWPCPRVTPPGRYPAPCSRVRTFLGKRECAPPRPPAPLPVQLDFPGFITVPVKSATRTSIPPKS